MKNVNLNLFRALSVSIIVSLLLSCFVISSSAEAVYQLDASGYYFSPEPGYFTFDESISVPLKFRTRSGRPYREIFVLYLVDDGYSIYFRNDINGYNDLICTISDGSVVYSDFALSDRSTRYLEVVSQSVSSSVYEFVLSNFIRGAYGGTFNFVSPSIFTVPLSSVSFSFDLFGYYQFSSFSVSLDPETNNRVLKFDNSLAYSSFLGYSEVIPNIRWNGQINVPGTYKYFTDRVSSEVFHSLFSSVPVDSPAVDNFQLGYEAGREVGFNEGRNQGYISGYDEGFTFGKEEGIEEGRNYTGSANLGENLLGDTLQKPFNAVMGIQLFDLPGGGAFTIGTALASVLSITFLLIFLKMFAGG